MSNNTSIIVAPVKMQPKPTKAEVIEAAVQVRLQEFAKEKASAEAKLKKLDAALKKKLVAYAKTLTIDNVLYATHYEWSNEHYVKLGVQGEFPEGIKSLLNERDQVARVVRTSICEKSLRQKIRAGLSNVSSKSERVNALMNDKETRKALLELSNAGE